jgi:hypothetical protein
MGPGYVFKDHCIDRQISDSISQLSKKENVDKCLAKTTWVTAWNCIEGDPHGGGHVGIGLEVSSSIYLLPLMMINLCAT